jgi:hypothetical protein
MAPLFVIARRPRPLCHGPACPGPPRLAFATRAKTGGRSHGAWGASPARVRRPRKEEPRKRKERECPARDAAVCLTILALRGVFPPNPSPLSWHQRRKAEPHRDAKTPNGLGDHSGTGTLATSSMALGAKRHHPIPCVMARLVRTTHDLPSRCRLGGATRRRRRHASNAERSKIEFIDKGFDDPNRIILGHVIVQRARQQLCRLTILKFNESPHGHAPGQADSSTVFRCYTTSIQSRPDASAQSVGQAARSSRSVRQPNHVLVNEIAGHKTEPRPRAGEEWRAATKHDGVEVEPILINKTKVG